MPTNKTQRSHWNNLEFSQMLSVCVSSRVGLPNVDLIVCVWRLLLVSIDRLDFICKEVYIPLSNFWSVPCSCCWNLIKLKSIFFSFSVYECVCFVGWGFRQGQEVCEYAHECLHIRCIPSPSITHMARGLCINFSMPLSVRETDLFCPIL